MYQQLTTCVSLGPGPSRDKVPSISMAKELQTSVQ